MIAVVNYHTGNPNSVINMLKHLGLNALITNDITILECATKLILPGVGHFDYGMQQLHTLGLVNVLQERVLQKKVPILGICLGMQLFTSASQEGKKPGLNWINGETINFDRKKLESGEKIPHMGWTDVNVTKGSKLFEGMYENPRFYFVHSYHLHLQNISDTLVTATHGYEFAAGVEHENIIGVQFHPEKSHKYGMKILENFIKNY
ncbi:MAG: imidazole glycerol phosphate synthase subunit HisH [Agriterribacter sp.]